MPFKCLHVVCTVSRLNKSKLNLRIVDAYLNAPISTFLHCLERVGSCWECWERVGSVGSVLGACWERVGSVLGACWECVGSTRKNVGSPKKSQI